MSESIADLVLKQTQPKIDAGEALEAAVNRVAELRDQLHTAEKEAGELRKKALKAGWTENQLRQANLITRKKAQSRSSQSRQSNAPADAQSAPGSATNFG